MVLYQGFHWASMNSAGLRKAGLGPATPERVPGGGVFFRDANDELTGVATESAIGGFLRPALEGINTKELAQSMFRLGGVLSSQGVTAFADLATGASGGVADIANLRRLAHNDAYPLRITATPLYQLLEELNGPIAWDGRFQAHRPKLLVDASLIGGTSATVAPQLMGGNGNLNYTPEEFEAALRTAMDQGYSLAVHTMGDRGHRVLLDSFEAVAKEYPAAQYSHGIEHSALLDPADIARVKALGLSVSQLTPFFYYYGDAMREVVYGEEMAEHLFNANSLLTAGVNLALHSDAPVFESRPLEFVWAAVNRTTRSGVTMGPQHAITPYQAMQGITINAARHLNLGDDLGSLEAGKLADMVILENNPLKVSPQQIRSIGIVATIKGGTTYYGKLP